MTGYSNKTLTQKLGLKAGMRVQWIDAPAEHQSWLPDLPAVTVAQHQLDFVHLFVMTRAALIEQLPDLRLLLNPAGMIWVSWPKKASKVPTDLTEDTIRDLALSLDLVDVKVCAVSEVWSGLKLVIPRASRTKSPQML